LTVGEKVDVVLSKNFFELIMAFRIGAFRYPRADRRDAVAHAHEVSLSQKCVLDVFFVARLLRVDIIGSRYISPLVMGIFFNHLCLHLTKSTHYKLKLIATREFTPVLLIAS
jgi:hypothetical protein